MRHRSGFTLIEVLVALTLAGFVVLAAHRIFGGVVDGVQRLTEAQRSLNRDANARALLAALIGSIEVNQQAAFRGEPEGLAFTGWCADSLGRAVWRRAVLHLEGAALTLQGVYADPVRLADSVTAVRFDYLLQFGVEQRFVGEWSSEASAPVAVRLRLTRGAVTDTLLLLVGWRG